MEKRKVAISIISLIILIFIFSLYGKHKKEKIELIKESDELERITGIIKEFVINNKGEFNEIKSEGNVKLYSVKIEDEYKIKLNSNVFKIEEKKENNIEKINVLTNKNELKISFEVNYYTLPKIAFLIDDVGMTTSLIKNFEDVKRPLNFAILPFLPKSKQANEILTSKGYITILHMPMEGSNDSLNKRTEGLIFKNMSDKEIQKKLDEAFSNVGEVKGFNNHMGSAFTSNKNKMEVVLNYAKNNNFFYVDSRTISTSKGYKLAKDMDIKTTYCKHFLDNNKNVEDIKKEIKKAVEITKKDKSALFIGHYHKNMAIALKESVNYIESQGIKIVPLSKILE